MQEKPPTGRTVSSARVSSGVDGGGGVTVKQMPPPVRQRRHTLSGESSPPPLANSARRISTRNSDEDSSRDATPVRRQPQPYQRSPGASPNGGGARTHRMIVKTLPFSRTNSQPTYTTTEDSAAATVDVFAQTTRPGFGDSPPPPPDVQATRTFRTSAPAEAPAPAAGSSSSAYRQLSPRRVVKPVSSSSNVSSAYASPKNPSVQPSPSIPPLVPTPPPSTEAPAPVPAPARPPQPGGPPPLAPRAHPTTAADDGHSGDGFSPRPETAAWRNRATASASGSATAKRTTSPQRPQSEQRRRPQSSRRPPTQSVQTARERAQQRRTAASMSPGRGMGRAAAEGVPRFPGAKKIEDDGVSLGTKLMIGAGLLTGAVTIFLLVRVVMSASPSPGPGTRAEPPRAPQRVLSSEETRRQNLEYISKFRASVIHRMRNMGNL